MGISPYTWYPTKHGRVIHGVQRHTRFYMKPCSLLHMAQLFAWELKGPIHWHNIVSTSRHFGWLERKYVKCVGAHTRKANPPQVPQKGGCRGVPTNSPSCGTCESLVGVGPHGYALTHTSHVFVPTSRVVGWLERHRSNVWGPIYTPLQPDVCVLTM